MFHDTLASVHHNILHPIHVSLRRRKTNDHVHTRSAFLCVHLPSPCIAPQLLSRGSTDGTILQVEVAWARGAITVAEVAHAAVVLATEASAQEAAPAHDGATLRIREAEDRVTVVEGEESEWESQAEVEHSAVLVSARADAEGLAQRIALLEGEFAKERRARETSEREHRACFEELTLL
jgi:hypothetical protein